MWEPPKTKEGKKLMAEEEKREKELGAKARFMMFAYQVMVTTPDGETMNGADAAVRDKVQQRKAMQQKMKAAAKSAVLVVLACLLLFFAWNDMRGKGHGNPLLPLATDQAENLAATMIVTYGSLRAINALLSVLQEVEVGGSAIVVQGSGHPLKFLEPVDDTVERVSDAIFILVVGATLMIVGLSPIAALGALALALGLLGSAYQAMRTEPSPWYRQWLQPLQQRLLRVGMLLAIILPLVVAAAIPIAELLTESAYESKTARLKCIIESEGQCPANNNNSNDDNVAAAIANGGATNANQSWRCRLLGIACGENADAVSQQDKAKADSLWSQADDLLKTTLSLIGIFLLRAVVLPVLLLWLALSLLKYIATPRQT